MACEEQELLFASIVTQKQHFLSRNVPTLAHNYLGESSRQGHYVNLSIHTALLIQQLMNLLLYCTKLNRPIFRWLLLLVQIN